MILIKNEDVDYICISKINTLLQANWHSSC